MQGRNLHVAPLHLLIFCVGDGKPTPYCGCLLPTAALWWTLAEAAFAAWAAIGSAGSAGAAWAHGTSLPEVAAVLPAGAAVATARTATPLTIAALPRALSSTAALTVTTSI